MLQSYDILYYMEQFSGFTPKTPESLQVEQNANYKGNWTLLQMERNKHFRDVYRTLLEERVAELEKEESQEATPEVPETRPSGVVNLSKTKVEDSLALLKKRVESFDTWMDDAYFQTGYVEALDVGKSRTALGMYSYNNQETFVFKDAMVKNAQGEAEPASGRQKDIIDAHEKIHQVYEILPQKTKEKVVEPFLEYLADYKSKSQADEILARMAQLKNYFGFSGGEQFTKEHLGYARKHYLEDTQMDNTMKDFFEKIGDEEVFVRNMNEIPC